MWKKIVEAPFQAVAWLFKSMYGRLVSVLILTLLCVVVNYPIRDVEVGVWEVRDVLKPAYSGTGRSDVDEAKRVEPTAVEESRVVRQVEVYDWFGYITLPFHSIASREIKLISETDLYDPDLWYVMRDPPSKFVNWVQQEKPGPEGPVLDEWTNEVLRLSLSLEKKAPAGPELQVTLYQTLEGRKAVHSQSFGTEDEAQTYAKTVRANPFQVIAEAQSEKALADYLVKVKVIKLTDKKVKHRQVAWVSRGLTLGLDLQGGTELRYKIAVSEGKRARINAPDIAQVIRRRIDAYGLKEPRVQPVGDGGLLVQIPGFDKSDVARVRGIITQTGHLEFRLVADAENNKAVLEQAKKTGKAPDGWHWYKLQREDPDRPGKFKIDDLLIEDQVQLTGDSIDPASVYVGRSETKPAVMVNFRDSGIFWNVTRKNIGRRLAIILDDRRDEENKLETRSADGKAEPYGRLVSAPTINSAIPGAAEISGDFTQRELEDLKYTLQSGILEVPLELESEQSIGPSQGQKGIDQGKTAMIYGMAAIIVFMAIYYTAAGTVADFALILNLLMLVAALSLRGATLTLPGIAGIILAMGMAVDANVLIFERIREEIKKAADKPLLKCMRDGHNRALVTIFDANLTTLITAIILYLFGTGPIRGFAVTLSYGLIISMFTAIVVTRIILEALVRTNTLKNMRMLQFVENANIPFVAMRKVAMAASGILIVASLVAIPLAPGKRLGIDFSSGTLVEVNLKEKVDTDLVRAKLAAVEGYKEAEVQEITTGIGSLAGGKGSSSFAIRLRYVPTVKIVKIGRVEDPNSPFAGGAEVIVQTDRPTDLAGMVKSLAAVGSAGADMKEESQSDQLHTYVVRNNDKMADATGKLASNVRTCFETEPVANDIRKAFSDQATGQSLLVPEGLIEVSQTQDQMAVSIALTAPAAPAQIEDALLKGTGQVMKVEAEGELDSNGLAASFLVTAKPGALPQIKNALRLAKLSILEPFGNVTRIYPAVARELFARAAIAVILSWLAICAYVWFRFEFRFGIGGVVALIHDVIITTGALVLMGYEIDLTIIAALLTIIGYSINDTIVVFDRIRENRKLIRKTTLPEIINISINQTLSRTILTSLTTLFAAIALFIWGGATIRPFAFAMVVGIITGTYSSIFIASPILLMMGEQGMQRGPLGAPVSRTVRPLEGMHSP